ncbi:MAG: CDP-glucose 4,6-dehydratase [Leptospiraceae bacterium]|nr:CDP-glucose 4,6-dehydratase [Leptospiraceae bacterium]NUM42277.1 CDP-glucose 4,6-dehydratase [Leptospiraceae bacterium]
MEINSFWKGKKVLLTGHTGFKGSWLTLWLKKLGAEIYGVSLDPITVPSIFQLAGISNEVKIDSRIDIRNLNELTKFFQEIKPEVVFHLAAQALVLDSYTNPVDTYSTNVMGTVNVLEAIRLTSSVKGAVIVTTDKCYENKEWFWGYRETESMGGHDPYSSSKGCAEIVTSAYRSSFFGEGKTAIATARAGNVIGGGDWSKDRLLPDFFKSIEKKEPLFLRFPNAIRPWQHVLEPIGGYVLLAEKLLGEDKQNFSEAWNFGPFDEDTKTVEWIAKTVCKQFPESSYKIDNSAKKHEANYLKLDISKARMKLGWSPKWNTLHALDATIEWYKSYQSGKDMNEFTRSQIDSYISYTRKD